MPKNTKVQRQRREAEGKFGNKISPDARKQKRAQSDQLTNSTDPSVVTQVVQSRKRGSITHDPRRFESYGSASKL